MLEKAQEIENAKGRREASIREKSSLETKIGLLDGLTEFFGPTGAIMGQTSARRDHLPRT